MSEYIIVHSVKVATEFGPETFGRLTTIGPKFRLPTGTLGRHTAYQVCQCSCGEQIIVRRCNFQDGHTRSCGCLQQEIAAKTKKTASGRPPAYNSWQCMIQRCTNHNRHNYVYYGGRGIRVCDRWLDPENGFIYFLEDMGQRPSTNHTIDRHPNPDGNYEPGNCRWATKTEQAMNRRNTVYLTAFGQTKTLRAWAESTGLDPDTIYRRCIKRKWDTERALSTPSGSRTRTPSR